MSNQPLQTTFQYLHKAVHTEDGWIHPLRDAVKDVAVAEAAWEPATDVASIWEVTAHATPYLYDVLRALRGEEKIAHEDWHEISDTSAGAWTTLRDGLLAGIDELGAEIAKLKEADYSVAPPNRETARWELLIDLSVHDAYHAGQIVKLKQLYAARVPAEKEVATV
jgi:uncharacterized damage-inducible protein DinB